MAESAAAETTSCPSGAVTTAPSPGGSSSPAVFALGAPQRAHESAQHESSAAQTAAGLLGIASAPTDYRSLRERIIRWKRGFWLTAPR